MKREEKTVWATDKGRDLVSKTRNGNFTIHPAICDRAEALELLQALQDALTEDSREDQD